MYKRIIVVALVLAGGMATLAAAQRANGEPEWKKAARADREKKLRKLELTISPVEIDFTTPRTQFRADESVLIRVGATNTSDEMMAFTYTDGYQNYFPRLLKDGLPVPYTQKAKERLADTSELMRFNASGVRIAPHAEERIAVLDLHRWYGQLKPGTYQLMVRFALDRTDRKVKTNTVVFEVVP